MCHWDKEVWYLGYLYGIMTLDQPCQTHEIRQKSNLEQKQMYLQGRQNNFHGACFFQNMVSVQQKKGSMPLKGPVDQQIHQKWMASLFN